MYYFFQDINIFLKIMRYYSLVCWWLGNRKYIFFCCVLEC